MGLTKKSCHEGRNRCSPISPLGLQRVSSNLCGGFTLSTALHPMNRVIVEGFEIGPAEQLVLACLSFACAALLVAIFFYLFRRRK